MQIEKTCCVTGHRGLAPYRLRQAEDALRTELVRAIGDGFTHFISGFAEGADLLFAQLVVEYRHQYPLTLEAAIPYPARLQNRDPRFQALLAQCDTVQRPQPPVFPRLLYDPQPLYGRSLPAGHRRLRRTLRRRDGRDNPLRPPDGHPRLLGPGVSMQKKQKASVSTLAFCFSLLCGVILAEEFRLALSQIAPGAGEALVDGGIALISIAGGLDLVGAVFIDHLKCAFRISGDVLHRRVRAVEVRRGPLSFLHRNIISRR